VPQPQPATLDDSGKHCPKCDGYRCSPLPPTNPKSELLWFKCEDCEYMWAIPRESHRQFRK